MEHFSLLRLAGLHHRIFDHFLFLLAAEEMCQSGRHEMFRRLVLVVESQMLQDDHKFTGLPFSATRSVFATYEHHFV